MPCLAARVLREKRDPVPFSDGTIEAVTKTQDHIVYQDLDVFRQVTVYPIPEDVPERGIAIAQFLQDTSHRGTGINGFGEDFAPGAVTPHELGHPGDGFDRDMGGFRWRIPQIELSFGHTRHLFAPEGGNQEIQSEHS